MNGNEQKQRNQRKHERRWAKIETIVAEMEEAGWSPIRLDGHSVRFRCIIPGQGKCTVAIKTTGGEWGGSIGFAQKKNGEWGSPMTDTDFLLFATGCEGKLWVWMLPMGRVVERLEAVQRYYDERGRSPTGALWMNIFAQPPVGSYAPCQLDLAEGAEPLWRLPLPWAPEAGETPDEPEEMIPPSPLAAYSVGQLIDELQRRGLKSFSF